MADAIIATEGACDTLRPPGDEADACVYSETLRRTNPRVDKSTGQQ
jgi:hypothetical protein